MAKAKTTYACTECGGQSPKWQGQCPLCGDWNSLEQRSSARAAAAFITTATGPIREGPCSATITFSATERSRHTRMV